MAAPRRFSAGWLRQSNERRAAREAARRAEIEALAQQRRRTLGERERLNRLRETERAAARSSKATAKNAERAARRSALQAFKEPEWRRGAYTAWLRTSYGNDAAAQFMRMEGSEQDRTIETALVRHKQWVAGGKAPLGLPLDTTIFYHSDPLGALVKGGFAALF